jgi:16S rRNA (cytosine967-C5)-methyltransferase
MPVKSPARQHAAKNWNARLLATVVLSDVLLHKRSLTDCLESHLNLLTDKREQALAQALCYGVMRWWTRLDAIVHALSTKPFKTKDVDIYVVLLLGIFQQLYLRVPPHAAIAETVELTRQLQKGWATAFVNAVLRNFQRQRETLLATVDQQETAQFAHPRWLLTQLQQDWSAQWQDIVNMNNQHPPMTLRVNIRQMSRETYLQHLEAAQIAATPTPHTQSGITLEHPLDVQQLPGFQQGWVSVQDGAAQFAAGLLDVPEAATVLDACAAPGGKTAHLLECYTIKNLTVLDNQPQRIQVVEQGLRRLKLLEDSENQKITLQCADASEPQHWWNGELFDRILLDVPCSATGIIRRHPDIKYLRQPEDIAALVAIQAKLLHQTWQLLKPHGKLLYVTCSLLVAENTGQIQHFMATHPDATLHALPELATLTVPSAVGNQLLPHSFFDGFYYACLVKTA